MLVINRIYGQVHMVLAPNDMQKLLHATTKNQNMKNSINKIEKYLLTVKTGYGQIMGIVARLAAIENLETNSFMKQLNIGFP